MNLQDQVTSLELSKRLKELGVKQNSLFHWFSNKRDNVQCWDIMYSTYDDIPDRYSAFTSSELGEMIPAILQPDTPSKSDLKFDSCKDIDNRWMVSYFYNLNLPAAICIIADTEANARAKMIIYLIENKLMELPNE